MHFGLQVPGARTSGGKLEVFSPYDGESLGTLDTLDANGAEKALSVAHAMFQDRSGWVPIEERIEILKRVALLMEERFDIYVELATREGGKPLRDTRIEMRRAIDGVYNCIECTRSEHGTEVPMQLNAASANRVAFTRREPIGPVVALSAFNHPINLIVHQVAPAIATGCPVIIKPAADTPLSAFAFSRLLEEAGLPPGWCQAVAVENHAITQALVTDDRIAFMSFIGSAKVGWYLKSILAAGTRCALEHGGVAPVIVSHDANLEEALPALLKGGMYHAGQVCVSVQRVFAHQSIASQLAALLADGANHLKVGDPMNDATEVGPLIRRSEVDRVEAVVDAAIAEGAKLLCGGRRLSDREYAPTILYNPSPESQISREEIFGPVISVYDYDSLDDAIASANSLPYAFQSAVFSQNIDTALYAASRLSASAVMVNDHTAFRVDWMPFAGLKQSGYGVGGIPFTYRDMQVEKLTVIRSTGL